MPDTLIQLFAPKSLQTHKLFDLSLVISLPHLRSLDHLGLKIHRTFFCVIIFTASSLSLPMCTAHTGFPVSSNAIFLSPCIINLSFPNSTIAPFCFFAQLINSFALPPFCKFSTVLFSNAVSGKAVLVCMFPVLRTTCGS